MAKFYIEEHYQLIKDVHGELVQSPGKPILVQPALTVGGTKATSAAFQPETKFLHISCDTACQFEVGPAPLTPANSDRYLPANGARFVACDAGDSIAVIEQQ